MLNNAIVELPESFLKLSRYGLGINWILVFLIKCLSDSVILEALDTYPVLDVELDPFVLQKNVCNEVE